MVAEPQSEVLLHTSDGRQFSEWRALDAAVRRRRQDAAQHSRHGLQEQLDFSTCSGSGRIRQHHPVLNSRPSLYHLTRQVSYNAILCFICSDGFNIHFGMGLLRLQPGLNIAHLLNNIEGNLLILLFT